MTKKSAFVLSTSNSFITTITAIIGNQVDNLCVESTLEALRTRIRQERATSKPRLVVIDAAVSEGLPASIKALKDDAWWLYVVAAGENMSHETVVATMRAQADHCIELAHFSEQFVTQALAESDSKNSKNILKNNADYLAKSQPEYVGGKSQKNRMQQKFAEFGLTFTDLPGGPATVLIVDDEPDIRFAITEFLTPEGYTILTAENGQVAVELIHTHPEIDVVIMDVRMPKLTGDHALKAIKQSGSRAEIIMLTAYQDRDIVVQSIRDDAFDYINKPIEYTDLLNKIAAAIRHKYGRVETDLQLPLEYRKQYLHAFLAGMAQHNQPARNRDIWEFIPELEDTSASADAPFDEAVLNRL